MPDPFRRAASNCATSRPASCSRGRRSSRSRSTRLQRTLSPPPTADASQTRRRGAAPEAAAPGDATRRARGEGARRRRTARGRAVRRHAARSQNRTPSTARQRQRHRLQQEGRPARLCRRRHGEGRQRPVRLRHRRRPHHALDNDAKIFSRLTWSEDGTALAALKGVESRRCASATTTSIAFADVRAALDDATAPPKPVDVRSVEGRRLSGALGRSAIARALTWSEDNKRVFFGIKEQVPAPDTTRGGTPTRPRTWTSGTRATNASNRCR